MINYQQHIDDLVLWYVNGVLSNILFSQIICFYLLWEISQHFTYAHSQEN
jgi:hypothetical protein